MFADTNACLFLSPMSAKTCTIMTTLVFTEYLKDFAHGLVRTCNEWNGPSHAC